jgi:RNA polymerase sigma-70 factor (ECF subfamily)
MTSADESTPEHLSQIETIVRCLQDGKRQDAGGEEARRQLALLYYGAAYRYLLGCLRDPDVAQELATEFAIRLMQGEYIKHAKPEKGRFRDYLKRCLSNLATDHWRRKRNVQSLPEDSAAYSPQDTPSFESDEQFLSSLREELVACAWKGLAACERDTGTPYETVLRLKTQQPELRSVQIAGQLSDTTGKPLTEQSVRKILQRARDKFADLLVDHVQNSLQVREAEALEEQLVELQLLEFCRPALERRLDEGKKQ